MSSVERAPAASAFPAPRQAWTVAGVLSIVTICAYVDRQLIYLFVEPLRRTLHLQDTQLSLIQGMAFVLFYIVMGIPLGRLVDRTNRRNLIVVGVVIWSIMTMAAGFAQGFWTLFAARAGVGVGEAILGPAVYSILSDYFDASRRGRAMALVALSATIGSGGSFLIGGLVLKAIPGDALVHLPLIGDRLGWQVAFMAAGAPGLLIALAVFAVREPVRKERAAPAGHAGPLLRPYLRRHGRLVFGLILANALLMLVAYAVAAWMATYFIRRFHLPPPTVGFAAGIISIVGALTGGWVGGAVSDWLMRRRVGGRADLLVACSALAIPLLATWTQAPWPLLSFVLLTGVLFSLNLAACTAPAVMQEIAPNELRGFVMGCNTTCQGIIAAGLGPTSVALVTDHVLHDPNAVGLSLPLVSVPLAAIVMVMAWFLRRPYAASRAEIIRTTAQGDAPATTPTSPAAFEAALAADAPLP